MIRKAISVLLVGTMLTGCVATTGPQRADSNGTTVTGMDDQTVTKVGGAILGTALGALVGYATGGARGAWIGAVAGGGLGFLAGIEVARRKAQYASEEEFLNAEIANADAINRDLRGYNGTLKKEIAKLDGESKRLASKYKAGKVSRDQVEAERSTVQTRIQKNQQVQASLTKELEVKTAVLNEEKGQRKASDPYVKSLEKQVKKLQANIGTLQNNSTQLAKIDARLSI
jgi:hypothetical protein